MARQLAAAIDRYHHWRRLGNAVNDAMGAAAVFQRLGFEQVTAPLVDDAATGKAIQSLVTDDLKMLGPDDSLVLFYAGHGGTRRHSLGDKLVKTGYLIPVDASDPADGRAPVRALGKLAAARCRSSGNDSRRRASVRYGALVNVRAGLNVWACAGPA